MGLQPHAPWPRARYGPARCNTAAPPTRLSCPWATHGSGTHVWAHILGPSSAGNDNPLKVPPPLPTHPHLSSSTPLFNPPSRAQEELLCLGKRQAVVEAGTAASAWAWAGCACPHLDMLTPSDCLLGAALPLHKRTQLAQRAVGGRGHHARLLAPCRWPPLKSSPSRG
jgi:hypothetical protein